MFCRRAVKLRLRPISKIREQKFICFSLDLEPDFGGRTGTAQAFADLGSFERWAKLVRQYDLKLTVFVVGNLLECLPQGLDDVLERLQGLGAEFELHSYTHEVGHVADPAEQIRRGKAAFRRRFGRDPRGYRAPFYRMSPNHLLVLAAEGFGYDSSLRPSFVKSLFTTDGVLTEPSYLENSPIVELPLAVVPGVRLPISLSYFKLLGLNVYRLLFRLCGFQSVLVFNFHLHDLFPVPTFELLPWPQKLKWILRRNQGIETFEACIRETLGRGYKSVYMSSLFETAKASIPL